MLALSYPDLLGRYPSYWLPQEWTVDCYKFPVYGKETHTYSYYNQFYIIVVLLDLFWQKGYDCICEDLSTTTEIQQLSWVIKFADRNFANTFLWAASQRTSGQDHVQYVSHILLLIIFKVSVFSFQSTVQKLF